MTNNNNNNPNQWKPDIPQTSTIAYYNPETEQNTIIAHEQLTKITNPSEFQVVNRSEPYQSEKALNSEPSYGPCSYSECRYDTAFSIEIYIEGLNRKWARRPNIGTFLPGNWEWSPLTSNYLYRTDLYLNNVDQGRKVCPLLVNDDVYSVNLWGKHTPEDVKFCNAALDIIRGAVRNHENGREIRINETLDSDDYRLKVQVAKWGAVAAASVVNPVAGAAAGVATWSVGQLAEEACDTERGKRFWRGVSGIGGDAFTGAVTNGITQGLFNTSGFCESSSVHESSKIFNFSKEFAQSAKEDFTLHRVHRARGISYDSDCSICNPCNNN